MSIDIIRVARSASAVSSPAKQSRIIKCEVLEGVGMIFFLPPRPPPLDLPHSQAWAIVGVPGFSGGGTITSGGQFYTTLAFQPNSSVPYVAYKDWSNGSKLTVMRFGQGSAWEVVGSPGFSAGAANFISLAFNPSTSLAYVAYQDVNTTGSKATVMRFTGMQWLRVGSPGFTATGVTSTSLAFQPNTSVPYLAYCDGQYSKKTIVMRFDNADWAMVGSTGFGTGSQDYQSRVSLAFQPSTSVPFVAYQDGLASGKATVMRFNGSVWVALGSPGFSANAATWVGLAFQQDSSVPYVVYNDQFVNASATVMRYTGSAWTTVGSPRFSAGQAGYINLAFSPTTNAPYIAYADTATGGHASVMRFDATANAWTYVGLRGFTPHETYFTSLAFAPNSSLPYIAYENVYSSKMWVWAYPSLS